MAEKKERTSLEKLQRLIDEMLFVSDLDKHRGRKALLKQWARELNCIHDNDLSNGLTDKSKQDAP